MQSVAFHSDSIGSGERTPLRAARIAGTPLSGSGACASTGGYLPAIL